MHVFTYGTLMFPEVWQAVVGREFATVAGTLASFAIYRVADAEFPGIVADADAEVRGVVYLDVDNDSLARLDRFEDVFYERLTLSIDCVDGQVRPADAYVVPAENCHVLTAEPWDRESFQVSGDLERFIRRFKGFERVAGEG